MAVEFRADRHRSEQFFQVVPFDGRKPLAHVVNEIPVELHCSTLIEALERAAEQDGLYLNLLDTRNRPHPLRYSDVLHGARRFATHLLDRGIRRNTKVVLLLPTGEDFVFAFYGVQMAGGVPVPCAPPFTFGGLDKYLDNLRHIVRNCEAEYFITNSKFKAAIGSVLADRNSLRHLILASEVDSEPAGARNFPTLSADDTAFLQYTSGTTNLPKGVILTHSNLLANVFGIGLGLGMCPDDVGMSWLPLFHDMGLIGVLFTSLYWHYPVHVMPPEAFVLHPHWWLENITRYKVTLSPAPNFAYHLCLRQVTEEQMQHLDLGTWRIALNGAEPVDHATVTQFRERFGQVGFGADVLYPVYGMAENSLAATFPDIREPYVVEPVDRDALEQFNQVKPPNGSSTFPYHAVSVGYPLAGQEVAIVDTDGSILPEDQVGEIIIRGPSTTAGYYQNDLETVRVLQDSWLHTGDMGFISRRRLYVTGRKKEMIIRMGRNYYPYDIERIAGRVDGVRKGCLAAFAAYNPDKGTEDLVLVAETRENDRQRLDLIEKAINGELLSVLGIRADHLVLAPPRTIPKTSSGKIQRMVCRQRFQQGQLVPQRSAAFFSPVTTLVKSFIGHQAFRLRRRAGMAQ